MKRYFYKVVVLTVTTYETLVTDERHFGSAAEARNYARSADPTGKTALIFRMDYSGGYGRCQT